MIVTLLSPRSFVLATEPQLVESAGQVLGTEMEAFVALVTAALEAPELKLSEIVPPGLACCWVLQLSWKLTLGVSVCPGSTSPRLTVVWLLGATMSPSALI